VKSFAKKIVKDHEKSCKKLQKLADKNGWAFPDTNSMAMNENGKWGSNRWHTNNWNGHSNWNSNSDSNYGQNANPAIDTNDMTTASSAGIGHENYKGAEVMELGNQSDTNMDNDMGAMRLNMLSGAEFDRAFVHQMIAGHEKAIRKFEMASENLQNSDLKKYAKKTLPTLREHLRMAQDLQSKVGMWSDSDRTNSGSMYHNGNSQNQ
jgi:putative membrane protein